MESQVTFEPAANIKAKMAYRSRKDIACAPEELAALTTAYYAAKLAEHAEKEVKLHNFTAEQIERIVGVLRAGAGSK